MKNGVLALSFFSPRTYQTNETHDPKNSKQNITHNKNLRRGNANREWKEIIIACGEYMGILRGIMSVSQNERVYLNNVRTQ